MLDRLLGREELKARIEELEEENRHLRRQRDAESERRADAVTDRQAAEERINRLEDKLAGLEGTAAATPDRDGDPTPTPRHREALRGDRLAEVLSRLESVRTDREGALTAMVGGNGELPDAAAEAAGDRAGLVDRAAPCLYCADDAGTVNAALAPPLPPEPFAEWGDRFRIDRSWFEPKGEYALALVRADTFALGRYEGRERIAVEGFESDVKSDHSKGGFSQGRFERLRDEQIANHVERCHEALAGVDGPLYVAGERTLLAAFADRATVTRPVDATGAPADALADAAREFWTTRLVAI